jgi:Esterase-like activity of phytase/Bacterial Ig domain
MRSGGSAVIVLASVLAVASCSPAPEPKSTSEGASLATPAGTPLSITPGQLLAATAGATPVAFGQPEHGQLGFGHGGAVVYTPAPGFTGIDHLQVTTTDAVKTFATDIAPLTTVAGVAIQASAYGSAIAMVPGSPGEVYGLTDRGPNVDGRTDNEKVLPVPDFHPQIGRFTLADGRATLAKTIILTGTDGVAMTGLVNPSATTGETMVDLAGRPLPTSDHGLDTEGLVAMPDGTFWVSDEYGPFLVHFDAQGKELERLSPFDGSLPRELSLRTPNQGMEGLTLTPDGSTLVGIMQSALKTPGLQGSAKDVPLSRIVTVHLADKSIHEYLYPLADPAKTKVAVSEITALSNTAFLVDERDGDIEPGANKKIYLADITRATDVGPHAVVAGATYRADNGGLQVDGEPIETLVGVSTDADAIAKLGAAGIVVAAKTLKLDLGGLLTQLNPRGELFGHDKIEGLATPDGGATLIIANDSDFGLAGIASDSPPFTLKPKMLAGGIQDTGEFLEVDTGKLPAQTKTVDIAIQVR